MKKATWARLPTTATVYKTGRVKHSPLSLSLMFSTTSVRKENKKYINILNLQKIRT